MKILLINTVPTEKNGITNVIFNYLQSIDATGFSFDYVSINKPEEQYVDAVQNKGGNVYVIPRSRWHVLSYFYTLASLIRKNKYDAIHVHTNSHTVVLELLAAKLGGCTIRITHSHNTTCNSVIMHKLLTPLFNILCTNRLACGIDAGKWMFGDTPFIVINNGVNTEKFAFNQLARERLRHDLDINENEMLIGHVGIFNDQKNHIFLIDIFNEIVSRNASYKLCLLGDGPHKGMITEKVGKLRIKDNVIFAGNVNNVHEYLSAFDLIVMPSLYEGLPLSLIEQQANGLPCFVSDTITKEADKTGNLIFLSLNDSAEKWANKVLHTLLPVDRKLESENAIVNIKKAGYSIQEEAQKLRQYCINVINENNARHYNINPHEE